MRSSSHNGIFRAVTRHSGPRKNPTRRRAIKSKIRRSQPIHKRFLLHPATIMVLLVAGVFIAGWTYHAVAASYSVTAKIPAPPLTEGAVITTPADGYVATSSPITVSGTCPDNSYVTLIRNGSPSGTAWCTGNTFSIDTSLSVGSNILQAQDYNITDDPGPATPSITITYQPPIAPPPPSSGGTTPGSGTTTGQTASPLTLQSTYHYRAYPVGSEIVWNVSISGGIPPYIARVAWGDGKSDTTSVPRAGTFSIEHTYTKPGYYAFKVYAQDARGNTAMLQLVAFIRATGAAGGITTPRPGAPSFSWLENVLNGLGGWLWLAWPTYITVVLMAASFWLGEQRAVQAILGKQVARRRLPQHHSH